MQNEEIMLHTLGSRFVQVEAAFGLGAQDWAQDLTGAGSRARAWGSTIGCTGGALWIRTLQSSLGTI